MLHGELGGLCHWGLHLSQMTPGQERHGFLPCYRSLLISPPTPPIPIPTAQPRGIKAKLGSSNCNIHVNINTEKKASETGAREIFLPQLGLAGQPWKKNTICEAMQEVTMSHRNPKWVEFCVKESHPIHTHPLGMIFISCFQNAPLVQT